MLGVGADDTFILVKAWTSQCAKAQLRMNQNHQSSNAISKINEDEHSDIEHQTTSKTKSHTKEVLHHKKFGEEELVKMVKATLKHSTLTISVTSITTSVAFFASFISNVTAIKCFRHVKNYLHCYILPYFFQKLVSEIKITNVFYYTM